MCLAIRSARRVFTDFKEEGGRASVIHKMAQKWNHIVEEKVHKRPLKSSPRLLEPTPREWVQALFDPSNGNYPNHLTNHRLYSWTTVTTR